MLGVRRRFHGDLRQNSKRKGCLQGVLREIVERSDECIKKTEKLHKKREIQWLASSVREGLGTFILICFWIKMIKEIA
jgi:hypothetical protein